MQRPMDHRFLTKNVSYSRDMVTFLTQCGRLTEPYRGHGQAAAHHPRRPTMSSTGTVMIDWMSCPIAASNLAHRMPLGAAGWSSCSVACGAGAGGSAPTAAPDAALMPPPCSRSFSVRSFSSPSSSPAPSSLSSSIIGVGVRRPLRPGASTDLTVTLAWHALCVHVAASRLLWRSSP